MQILRNRSRFFIDTTKDAKEIHDLENETILCLVDHLVKEGNGKFLSNLKNFKSLKNWLHNHSEYKCCSFCMDKLNRL